MREVTLAAVRRDKTGKGAARQARMVGNIPAVVYGPEIEPYPIEVSEKALRAAVKAASSASAIFDLEIDGKKNKVLIRDIQRDPITSHVTHLDFHAISMNKPINVMVPLHFIGLADGVKNEGGILQTTMREIEISCLPKDLPEHIEIDVTKLQVGDSIHVRDLQVGDIKILAEEQRTIVVVAAPTVAEVVKTEGEEEAVAAEDNKAEEAEKEE